MTDEAPPAKPRTRKKAPSEPPAPDWGSEADALQARLAFEPTRSSTDFECESLFSSTLRFANAVVGGLPYEDRTFSAVNNLRKVATDAHAERMVLRRRVEDLYAHIKRLEDALNASTAELELSRSHMVESARILNLIKSRVPSWVWKRLVRDPR